MTSKRFVLLVSLLFFGLLLPAAGAGPAAPAGWWPPVTLRAADGSEYDAFGGSVALHGDVAVIGAPGTGHAYVFTHDGAVWGQRARLIAPEPVADGFGGRVALDGQTLVVAAPLAPRGEVGDDDLAPVAGAVYVYNGGDDTWTLQTKLMPPALQAFAHFGHAVALQDALQGDALLVGAPYFNSSTTGEAVFAYRRAGQAWGAPQVIAHPNGAPRHFGAAVALAGNVALVGAPGIVCCGEGEATEKGIVYVYTRGGNTWSPAGSIRPAGGFVGDHFGCAIAFDGATAVIASCQENGRLAVRLLAHVFTRNGTTFTPVARLEPEGGAPFPAGQGLIESVTLDGDTLLLGTARTPTPGEEPGRGRFYVYQRAGNAWTLTTTLDSPGSQRDTGFGLAAALSERHLLAGAPALMKVNLTNYGGVIAYRRTAAPATTLFAPLIAMPAVTSPDGLIAYAAEGVAGDLDIFIVRPDGTGATNITRSLGSEYAPAWSPDGTRLAFREPSPGGDVLVSTNAAGFDKRQLFFVPGIYRGTTIAWSPDGTRLAFDGDLDGVESDVFVVNVDGSGFLNLTANYGDHNQTPTWSPDGRHILITSQGRQSGAIRQLATIPPGGGPRVLLTSADYHHNFPDYSPDGVSILFTSGQGSGPSNLYTMPAGGGPRSLLIEHAVRGRWSPDGTRIVFAGDAGGLFLANADGSGITPLIDAERIDAPDWQP